MTENPFAPTIDLAEDEHAVFGDHAFRIRRSFLYREISISQPLNAIFVYNGWWFRQKITVNGHPAWFRISWLRIWRKAEFKLPIETDPLKRSCRIEIEFSRILWIKCFHLWIDDDLVYHEFR